MVRNGRPLCGTGVEDSPLALQSPRVGEGASGTLSAAPGYSLLQTYLDERASGGQGALPARIPTRVPLDPVGMRKGSSSAGMPYPPDTMR